MASYYVTDLFFLKISKFSNCIHKFVQSTKKVLEFKYYFNTLKTYSLIIFGIRYNLVKLYCIVLGSNVIFVYFIITVKYA